MGRHTHIHRGGTGERERRGEWKERQIYMSACSLSLCEQWRGCGGGGSIGGGDG
jgi:hypothetical protein